MRDHGRGSAHPEAGLLPLQTRELALVADNGQQLISGVDLNLRAATLTVVMGPNGAGKSVLLRLLHGLIRPTSGTILYAGRPLDGAIRKRQALVFQRPVLLRRSVAANVDFALNLRPGRDADCHRGCDPGRNRSRREELLAKVGLLDHAKQPARLLSGGEQQRLALARALATNPEIIFLDEPTASLDPASTDMIERIVGEAHVAGAKVIYVTHDIAQARRLAQDVVFLSAGRLAEVSTAARFFANPASMAGQAYLEGRLVH